MLLCLCNTAVCITLFVNNYPKKLFFSLNTDQLVYMQCGRWLPIPLTVALCFAQNSYLHDDCTIDNRVVMQKPCLNNDLSMKRCFLSVIMVATLFLKMDFCRDIKQDLT